MPDRQELARHPTRVRRLNSLAGVRRELCKLYWDAREGQIPTQDASRLAFILSALARIIESGELVRRIERLEEAIENDARTIDD